MKKLTKEEFINRSIEIHGNKFDYSKTEFKNVRSKIILICPNHGEITIRVSNHIHMKQGCDDCARDKHRLTELSKERLEKSI